MFDNGPYLGPEALELGLVDELAYRDEAYDALLEEAGPRARMLYLARYLERSGDFHRKGTGIALIHGTGAVVRGAGGFSPLTGAASMGSTTVAGALRDAIAADNVDAIILRVDSPGGSYIASDTIYRETLRAKEAGKPVIVSMGNVAASGGYFVAMEADAIVAQPGTITGSIGVLGGKMITTGLYDKLGLSFDEVQSSENGGIFSSLADYDEKEYERFQAGLNRIYADFTQKAATGRDMPLEELREVAKGRIWTGEDALEIGLVDALGGYEVAIAKAREALGLGEAAPIRLREFPRPVSPYDAFFGQGPENSGKVAVKALYESLEPMRPVLVDLERAGVFGERGVLMAPGVDRLVW